MEGESRRSRRICSDREKFDKSVDMKVKNCSRECIGFLAAVFCINLRVLACQMITAKIKFTRLTEGGADQIIVSLIYFNFF